MIMIRLIDARRGLSCKCRELFKNERIADEIYRYLCDGLEECENVEPERKKGKWIQETKHYKDDEQEYYYYEEHCSNCGVKREIGWGYTNFCPNCGCEMER